MSILLETLYPIWSTWFVEKPIITELSNDRVMLSGRCRSCFGTGRIYRGGDYESCRSCNSFSGYLSFITKRPSKDEPYQNDRKF